MKRLISLIRTDLKLSMSSSGQVLNRKKRHTASKAVGYALYVVLGLFMAMTSFMMTKNALPLHQEGAVVRYIVEFGLILVTMTMFTFVPATLFYGDQTRIYLSMPLTMSEIILTKFVTLMIEGYLAIASVTLPMAIGYILATPSLQALLGWLVVLVLLPVVPVCLVVLFMFLVVKLLPFLRDERRLSGVMGVMSVVGIMLYVFILQGSGSEGPIRTDLSSVLPSWVGFVFPVLTTSEGILLGEGATTFSQVGRLFGVSLVWLVVTVGLASVIYRSLLLSMKGQSAGKKLSKEQTSKGVVSKGTPFKALMKRERRSVLRSPVFIIQGIASPYVMIAMIWGGMIFGYSHAAEGDGFSALTMFLASLFENPLYALTFGIGAGFLIGEQATIGGLTTTAFTRDAYHLDFLKSIPVSAETLFRAKLLTGFAFTVPPMALLWILMFVFVPFHPLAHLTMVVVSLIISFSVCIIDLFLDARHPRLDWMDENAIFRGNRNVILGSIISFVFLIVMIPLIAMGWFIPAAFILFFLYTAIGIALLFYLDRNAEEILKNMGNEA